MRFSGLTMFPVFPAVPLAPMGAEARRELTEALAYMKMLRRAPGAMEHIKRGYARLWADICLGLGVLPSQAAGKRQKMFTPVSERFKAAVGAIGLHTSFDAVLLAPDVAGRAAEYWKEARGPDSGQRGLPLFESEANDFYQILTGSQTC